ncbi:glycosyltransferase family 2 protein [Enemella evansiae]|nr:glycosyltransferase [Enemella evansiae]PFG68512.1 glycosyl transferase family 2 [Propionibacteriaceae bacterium ES.041]
MTGIDAMVVVVPAHNEADWLATCLASVQRAVRRVRIPVRVRVVLDACQDATAAQVPRWVHSLEVQYRNVGAARAVGFADLLEAPEVESPGRRTWLSCTDADSEVPADWLVAQLDSAAAGHDLFVGTVRVDDWSGRAPGLLAQHDLGYDLQPGHRHVHGANLGVRLSAYRSLGGFKPLRVHEDVELVRAAVDAQLPVDWSDAAPVLTSARRSTRAPGGFAAALDALEEQLRFEERHPLSTEGGGR